MDLGKQEKNSLRTHLFSILRIQLKVNGMIFVQKALSMMDKGYAAVIIQSSAGTGKATEYNKKNTQGKYLAGKHQNACGSVYW
ncbi:Uncharacterised protein [Escherichia coli]|uniref:Uncharacterized protein n=1 Tax=Escherichia coli TaxID=562 RepID=A0A376W3Q9_ECOLX|nr:Uncharacterised protein [Escherichia coli]